MVNYAWEGRSQGKHWWKPEAVLTCKSLVIPGYRGERPIEPSGSWFPPKFPAGKPVVKKQLYEVKRMTRGTGDGRASAYSQTKNVYAIYNYGREWNTTEWARTGKQLRRSGKNRTPRRGAKTPATRRKGVGS